MKIKAAVLYKTNSPFIIEELDLEEPHGGEVLVKVKSAGVCHSDWHIVTGATKHPLPVVVGHEGAGIVETVGKNVDDIKPGDQVILNWAPNCGNCFYCNINSPSLCETYIEPIWAGTMMDGTTRLSKNTIPIYHYSSLACFAEYIVVPQECCVKINHKVPSNVAALIGCAVTTGVGSVLKTAKVKPNSNVVVFGVGGVGLSTIMGAKFSSAQKIIAIDVTEEKRKISIECGATNYLNNDDKVIEKIFELTDGHGADYVFEAVGIPKVQERAFKAARSGGTIIYSGLSPMGTETNLSGALITREEKTVMGSYYGSANTSIDFPYYADLYLEGKLELNKLVSRTYPLDKINEAYLDLLGGSSARGIISFE
jgi:Zn-dependent alcohol dehydrogenase